MCLYYFRSVHLNTKNGQLYNNTQTQNTMNLKNLYTNNTHQTAKFSVILSSLYAIFKYCIDYYYYFFFNYLKVTNRLLLMS